MISAKRVQCLPELGWVFITGSATCHQVGAAADLIASLQTQNKAERRCITQSQELDQLNGILENALDSRHKNGHPDLPEDHETRSLQPPLFSADILEAIDGLALEQPTFSPQEVWVHIHKEFFQSPGRITSGYPDPLKQRFVQLPGVLAAYIHQLAAANRSQWPAEKLRAAISWHYTKAEMLAGGHPHDRWVVDTAADGTLTPRGNPAKTAIISQILAGLSKVNKRERTPKRASPMSLSMLSKIIAFLESDPMFNETMRLWVSAVCSLAFYGMCRINEVLPMKKGDIQLGLRRKARMTGAAIRFGCFTIRDRKTDHDPLASRTYSLHLLPKEEKTAEALTYLSRWSHHAQTELHHRWSSDDYAFPSLTKIPRGGAKRQRCAGNGGRVPFAKVGIKWGTPMKDSNFTQVLNIVAAAAGINRSVLGDEIWFTSHCFRRGGAQYRFMFAPEKRNWSLKLVKWWVGWAPSEKAETVTRYLLDDVMDREVNRLGDSLAPDADACITAASLDGLQNIDYGRTYSDADDDPQFNPTYAAPDEVPPALHPSTIAELKDGLLEGLRGMVQGVGCGQNDTQETEDGEHAEDAIATCEGTVEETTRLVSELPDAKSWRDYVHQYWHPNRACHQYRAGVGMPPHERKIHRSRLSRMKIIAEFIRAEYDDDQDLFEKDFGGRVQGELTVNKILAAIRASRRDVPAVVL
ncbi:hypothetical protein PHYSODRAFT_329071 [Phytophthora sojae]|uniref:Tyr recombinase domain-containing protein n=1 Tax=Phytophthora sojae (strain P6497) TaxID=1094619 RepID=G4Z6X7_PHYSP|nr:hypothetical protein PHYSODRAFT_329071 [Phytophthora sojae]EGZ21031.1 hypothetical protein PHYSODRAFT_329071 [Phytophthora sojae]|eukprot:XP_009523748.1 hypothetical protein PHYSODRAFT_329071 [Phytophthora sojae]